MVFTYVSDPDYFIPGRQVEEVESITYRFLFFIPITLRTRHVPLKWNRQSPAGPLGVGTTFVQVMALSGVPSETFLEITEYDPPKTIACKFSGGAVPPGEARIVLVPFADGTRVIETMKVKGGCYRLIGPFLTPLMKRQAKIDLHKLKERLESLPEEN